MTNGKCIYHRELKAEVDHLKKQRAEDRRQLICVDESQWSEINTVKSTLGDCIKTKTIIAMGAVVVLCLLTVFGVVWAEVSATREATVRIEKKLILMRPDELGRDEWKEE